MPETPYMETEALLAILNGDRDQATWIVAEMLDSEVRRFGDQVEFLLDVVAGDLRRRRLLAQGGTGILVPEGGTSD